MRDSQPSRTTQSRIRRRAVILAVILAAGPLGAQQPYPSAPSRPPLPLMASSGGQIKANPFCSPDSDGYRVRLTSGKRPQAVRLNPVGVAVGLQPIQQRESDSHSSFSRTVESTPTPNVKNNLLVGSEHHKNQQLVDTQVATATRPTANVSPVQNSATVGTSVSISDDVAIINSRPAAKPTPADDMQPLDGALPVNDTWLPGESLLAHYDQGQPDVRDSTKSGRRSSIILIPPVASVIQTDTPTDVLPPADVPPPADILPPAEPSQAEAAAVHATPPQRPEVAIASDTEATEPIHISFSDLSDRSTGADQGTPSQDPEPDSERSDRSSAVSLQPAQTDGTGEADLPEPIVIGTRRGVILTVPDQPQDELQWIQPVVIDEQPERIAAAPAIAETQPLLAPPPLTVAEATTQPAPEIIYRDEPSVGEHTVTAPIVTAPVAIAETSLHDTRYRPPVAVTQIPVAVGRGEADGSTAIIRPTVTPVQAPLLGQVEQIAPADGIAREKLTPLYMSRTQIRSLTIGGKLKGVQVGDKDICQAFAAGTNELRLIGTGNGVTQLLVWAETSSGDKTLMRAFEVHVEETVAVTGEAVEQRAAMLNRSIDKMFPDCHIQVTRQENHLLVRGSCDSDESATKILRIVRKTCLVPVRDELEIR